jgi:group I intron endonuclease
MGYIYMFTSPKNKRYIGQTIRPIEERLKKHFLPSSSCKAIYGAIKKHGWENMKKEWIEIPDDELNFYEEMLVALLGTLAPGGYNLKEGGGNGKPCEEVRKKLSDSYKGKTHTEESKQKMSDKQKGENHPMYGKTHTYEAKQNMRNSHLGDKNPLSKKVYQYDLDGTFVKLFASTGDAARILNKSDGSAITKCARGERITAYGFKWSYTKL